MILLIPTLALLAPTLDDPAEHHPAGSVLYLEVPDVPAALEAYGRTALFKTVMDPELHAAIGQVMGLEELDPIAMLEAEYRSAVESGQVPPLKELLLDPLRSMSLSVSAPGGSILPMVLAVMQDEGTAQEHLTQLGVQIELVLADTAAAEQLVAMLENLAGGEDSFEYSKVRGASVLREKTADPIGQLVALVQDGPRLCLLFGAEGPESYLERVHGQAEGYEHREPEALTGRGTTVLNYEASFAAELLSLPQLAPAGPLIDLAEGLVGPVVTMLARGGTWRVGIDDQGRVITEGVHPRPSGPLDGVFGSAPLDPAAYDLIHPDAIVGWAAHFDSDPLLAFLAELLGGLDEDPMAQLEETYGFRPDRDLLAPLGSALAYSLPEPKSLLAAPPLMLSAALNKSEDRAAFERGMDGLGRLLMAETEGTLELSTSEYRGMRFYSFEIDWSNFGLPEEIPIDPSVFFKPTVVVCDDRVFLTTLPNHAKREVRRILSQDSLTGEAREYPEGCTSVGFADWFRFVGKLYNAGRALATMAAMSGEVLPFDPAALPPPELITGRFKESLRWKKLLGEDQVLHFQESSFGPEILLAGALAGLGLGIRESQAQVEAVQANEELQAISISSADDLRLMAQQRCQLLLAAVELFQADQGRWPSDLSELSASTDSHPGGYLRGSSAADPWGRAYHLRIEDGSALIWSDGPNRLDENGRGDDVTVR